MGIENGNVAAAERLYLVVYERTVARSDYLQPDDHRQLLPEAVIIAAVVSVISGIISGIANGFLARVGEQLADKTADRLKRWKSAQPDPEGLVGVMTEAVPVLRSPATNWDEVAACIALELTRQGMRFRISQELASEIVVGMQHELELTE